MRIVHICLNGPFTEGLTYQENLLTKYQSRMGNEIIVITTEYYWNADGKLQKSEIHDSINQYDVRVIRLKIKGDKEFNYRFKKYINLYETLESLSPEILFIHGANFLDLKILKKYLKKHQITAYLDNHCDKSNSGRNFLSYNILHKIVWKTLAQSINPYIRKFYGVMPSRVKWLIDVYGLPKNKCELLIMGADDDFVNKYSNEDLIIKNRRKYNIKENEFVIVTGGKIDSAKTQTLLLMKAIKKMNNEALKLFIFGSISDELKEEFNSLCDNNIKYLGWANEEESYNYFSIADLVVFPGRHSVYWEEVVALGKPLICKYWEGTTHVDIGGNLLYLYHDSVEEMTKTISNLVENKNEYNKLLLGAKNDKKNNFLYSEIAKKSLESR